MSLEGLTMLKVRKVVRDLTQVEAADLALFLAAVVQEAPECSYADLALLIVSALRG